MTTTTRPYRRAAIVLPALVLAFALAAAVPSAGAAPKQPPAIVGGTEVQPGQYPALAALLYKDPAFTAQERFFCTATVIDRTHVLTAAHCAEAFFLWDSSQQTFVGQPIEVQVGSRDLGDPAATLVDATSIAIVKRWAQGATPSEDLGIITLAAPVTTPVARLASAADAALIKKRQPVEIAGWGLTEKVLIGEYPTTGVPTRAQRADVNVVPHGQCRKLYNQNVHKGFVRAGTDICAGTPGTGGCYGDSGGPMYAREPGTGNLVQVGVTSRGLGCATIFPGVWTKVAAMRTWIEATRQFGCADLAFPEYPQVPIYAC